MDEIVYGWVDSIPPTQTFYSYLMNNYWETNYAASQEGVSSIRYIIMPHEGFDPAASEKAAIEQRQPLLTRKGGGWQKERASLLRLKNDNLVITSIKPVNRGKEILVMLYNAGQADEIPVWDMPFKSMVLSDPDGLEEKPVDGNDSIPPGGIRHLKVTL